MVKFPILQKPRKYIKNAVGKEEYNNPEQKKVSRVVKSFIVPQKRVVKKAGNIKEISYGLENMAGSLKKQINIAKENERRKEIADLKKSIADLTNIVNMQNQSRNFETTGVLNNADINLKTETVLEQPESILKDEVILKDEIKSEESSLKSDELSDIDNKINTMQKKLELLNKHALEKQVNSFDKSLDTRTGCRQFIEKVNMLNISEEQKTSQILKALVSFYKSNNKNALKELLVEMNMDLTGEVGNVLVDKDFLFGSERRALVETINQKKTNESYVDPELTFSDNVSGVKTREGCIQLLEKIMENNAIDEENRQSQISRALLVYKKVSNEFEIQKLIIDMGIELSENFKNELIKKEVLTSEEIEQCKNVKTQIAKVDEIINSNKNFLSSIVTNEFDNKKYLNNFLSISMLKLGDKIVFFNSHDEKVFKEISHLVNYGYVTPDLLFETIKNKNIIFSETLKIRLFENGIIPSLSDDYFPKDTSTSSKTEIKRYQELINNIALNMSKFSQIDRSIINFDDVVETIKNVSAIRMENNKINNVGVLQSLIDASFNVDIRVRVAEVLGLVSEDEDDEED